MFDYTEARRAMVHSQVRTQDVTDIALQNAMLQVPRERFVPPGKKAIAYSEKMIEVADGRKMMCPRDFAKLVQAADIQDTDVVLDIGFGLGYSCAVLGHLAETVIGVENCEDCVDAATQNLMDADVTNAVVIKADLKSGAPEHGPFNVIFVGGAVEAVSPAWLNQLANGGRLAVVEMENGVGRAKIYTRSGDSVGDRVVFDATADVLPGFAAEKEFVF